MTDSQTFTEARNKRGNQYSNSLTSKHFCGSESIAVTSDFEPFHQNKEIFCRGFWDPKVANKMTYKFFRSFVKPEARFRNVDGFEQRDFALRNGPWVVTNMFADMFKEEDRRDGFWDDFSAYTPPNVSPVEVADPARMSREIKQVAKFYDADLVGITDYDERWTYRSKFTARDMNPACKPMDLPEGLTNAIVIARSMDYDVIRTSPTATAAASAAQGYAQDAVTLLALAQYIRSLGYKAVACQNDTTLAVPYAIKAGLGEYGRHGLVITKEFGPRVRFGRVLTDLPLAHDKPLRFGVMKTCEVCRRCANNCPPQAIDHGKPSEYRFNDSNIKGVRKWSTDAEKCFKFWVSKGASCANCIRTCPYNKDFSKWYFRVLRFFLGSPLRRIALIVDDWLRLHDQVSPASWWNRKTTRRDIIERAENHKLNPEKYARQQRVKEIREKKRRQQQANSAS